MAKIKSPLEKAKTDKERQAILNGYSKKLQKWTLELRKRNAEMDKKLRKKSPPTKYQENPTSDIQILIRALNVQHEDSQKLIAQNEEGLARMQKMQGTMNERLIRLEDRKNGSHKK